MLLLSENCLYGFKISSKKGLMLMLSSKKGLLRCYWDEICSHVLQTEFCCVCVCVCVYPRYVWFPIVSDIIQFKRNFKINLTDAHEHKFILGLVNESNSAPV